MHNMQHSPTPHRLELSLPLCTTDKRCRHLAACTSLWHNQANSSLERIVFQPFGPAVNFVL